MYDLKELKLSFYRTEKYILYSECTSILHIFCLTQKSNLIWLFVTEDFLDGAVAAEVHNDWDVEL